MFFGKTFFIVSLLLASFFLMQHTCQTEPDADPSQFYNISPEEAEQLIAQNSDNPDFIILDIRTLNEYNTGHIANAMQIDYYADDFKNQLEHLDKEKTYLIYCRTGNRSGHALPIMEELGFRKGYNMTGGITQWTAEGRPVTTQ